jgi:hypothetical protein
MKLIPSEVLKTGNIVVEKNGYPGIKTAKKYIPKTLLPARWHILY